MDVIIGKYLLSYGHSGVGEEVVIVSYGYNEGLNKATVIRDLLNYNNSSFRRSYLSR